MSENAHYIHGDEPNHVVVLHDWSEDHTNYDPSLRYLDGVAFTYAFMDARGYGGSKFMAAEFIAEEISGDAIGLADKLGWDKFHIMGHSMAGMVVQLVATKIPDRVKSVVAVTPASSRGLSLDDQTWDFFWAICEEAEAAAQGFASFVGPGRLSNGWHQLKGSQFIETSTLEARRGYMDMFVKTDFSDRANGLKTPILAITGEFDGEPFQRGAVEKHFSSLYPNLEVVTIPNVGHYPMMEFRRHGRAVLVITLSLSWLGFLDTYRTMCIAPSSDFRQVLEDVRELKLAT